MPIIQMPCRSAITPCGWKGGGVFRHAALALCALAALMHLPGPAQVRAAGETQVPDLASQALRKKEQTSHWSLQPLKAQKVPVVSGYKFESAIDAFIAARLRTNGLSHSPAADRATLIRRLSFDLIGLPPSPREIDDFVQNQFPEAYEQLVERLLASPHYGERWGRHWLDVARYTESQGFEYDKLRDNAWHYRDYVIRSFNEDKPYDRFMKEQ